MRIAYICADPGIPIFGRKGASIHVQEVVRALLRCGIQVDLFATRLDGDSAPGLEAVPVHRRPPVGKGDAAERERIALAANEGLHRALANAGPFDFIYERYSLWSYAGMEFARDAGIPGLLEVNAPLVEEQSRHRSLVDRAMAEDVAQRTFAAATALVAVSDGIGDYLKGFAEAAGKVHVIPNGVDPNRFPLDQPPAITSEADTFTVGFVGTLKAWHGLETLVEAFSQLHGNNPGYRLLVVGDGPYRAEIEQMLTVRGLSDFVRFTGAVDHGDVPSWLAAMDVGVAPYPPLDDFYFSPLKIYEYMAAGLPVVASRIGQIQGLIRHNDNGLLYPPGDVAALVKEIQRLHQDPNLGQALSHAARRTILDGHTWDHVAARILALAQPTPIEPLPTSPLSPDHEEEAMLGPSKVERPTSIVQVFSALWQIVYRFRQQIAGQWPLIAGALVAMLASIGLKLLEPWPLKLVVDLLSDQPLRNVPAGAGYLATLDTQSLLALIGLALLLIVGGRAAASYASTVGLALAGNRVLVQVRGEVYRHLLHLPLAYHTRARTGDLLTRLIGDIGRLQEVAITAMLPLMVNVLTLIGMVAMMLWLNWRLALVGLLALPLVSLLMRRQSGRIREAARRQRQREGVLAASAAETLNAMPVVHTLGLQEVVEKTFAGTAQKDLKESVRTARYAAGLERSVDVCIGLGTGLTLWYGAQLALSGALSAGDLVIFLSYLKSAFKPMNDLAKYTSRLAKAVASGERVLDVLDTELTIADAPDAIPAVQLRGAVTFDHVYFSYLPGHEILQNIHVQIEPGQRVAVVGPSGGGKSTLLSLLPRLYEPTGGQVLLDGKDIRCYTLKSLRNQISVVPQESMLFGVSVRENIAYGAPGASDAEIEAAARLASAHDFILNLPDGYDTILGEGGATLSGGQRQRIAVARAALRQSALVILDEPTASLDNENEQIVYDALERLVKGRTSFWITHDLRAAERADLILYIEDGRIQEQGTHAELLDLNGRYAAIYAIQAQIRGRDEARVPDVQKGEIAYALAR